MLKIPETVLREIYDHTEASYPNECCGVIIGTMGDGTRTAHAFRKCRNLNTERPHDRYQMDPLDMVRAQREFQDIPWEIVGIYHSHPDHPSRPSQTDLDDAASGYSYVIVSVRKGTVASANSWVLHEEGERRFDEEPLVIEGEDRK